jgi:hypothetical protein
MIKTNFKSIVPVVASLMLGVTLLAPTVFADTATSTPVFNPIGIRHPIPVNGIMPKVNSCSVYSDKAAKQAQNAADKQVKLDSQRANQLSKLNINRSNNDQKLANNRLAADQKRAQAMTKLQGKNATDAQKAAIATFQAAVTQAVSDRRAAVNAAITTYRTALDQALASRISNVDQATTTYATAVQAAYAKAYSDCQANVDKKTVKSNLNAALKAAQQQFSANHQSVAKLQTIISPLATARKTAVTAAESAFKTAITAATTALKSAFPAKTTTTKK